MSESSIISQFRFVSYKIDTLRFKVKPSIALIELGANFNPGLWEFSVSVRRPLFFKKKSIYLGGLNCAVRLFPQDLSLEKKEDEKAFVSLDAGIAGIFKVEADRFEKSTEDQLVRLQIPTILLPYLRGAVTSLMANAGFGSVVFPLINMHEVVRNTADLEVETKD